MTWTAGPGDYIINGAGTQTGTIGAVTNTVRQVQITGPFKSSVGDRTVTITGTISNCVGSGTWRLNCGGTPHSGTWSIP